MESFYTHVTENFIGSASMKLKTFSDTPILDDQQDSLKLSTYTSPLTKFILSCETPMTIGIQGNWGTGKTSLMNLLRNKLKNQQVLSIWINTWEHSILVPSVTTTPRILLSMVQSLKGFRQEEFENKTDFVSDKVRDSLGVLGNIINQFTTSKLGVDIDKAKSEESYNIKESPVIQLRSALQELVGHIIQSKRNNYQRIVFFIDDLDRIKPSDAVEIIETLKNVFVDVTNCVFVLAIDYEVVKKGLVSRYGNQKENEREFKSFFDKMIQVPFSMPVQALDVEAFVKQSLEELGIAKHTKFFSDYNQLLKLSVGSNPRSLKRFLNVYSLLRPMVDVDRKADLDLANILLATINAMQISFPNAYQRFLSNPNLNNWDSDDFEVLVSEVTKQALSDFTDEEDIEALWQNKELEKIPEVNFFKTVKDKLSGYDNFQRVLNKVMTISKITSVAQVEKAVARAVVALDEHFENTNVYDQEARKKFENLVEDIRRNSEYEIKVAKTQCSVKKKGYKNSIYLTARKNSISFSTAAIEDEALYKNVYDGIESRIESVRVAEVKKYTGKLFHLTGSLSYGSNDEDLVSSILEIVEVHAIKIQQIKK